jgi:hypothetical protein
MMILDPPWLLVALALTLPLRHCASSVATVHCQLSLGRAAPRGPAPCQCAPPQASSPWSSRQPCTSWRRCSSEASFGWPPARWCATAVEWYWRCGRADCGCAGPQDALAGSAPPLPSDPAGSLLRGKRALVVGGTRGIGRGIALTLAGSGARYYSQ